jgi:ABC-type transporter Mla subunit MlaD|tara:strand:+ start:1466 stop:1936 length:471 start_codon:yes stop_codon:yes gene_type:complete
LATKVVEEIDFINNKKLFISAFFIIIFFTFFIFSSLKKTTYNYHYNFQATFNSIDGISFESKILLAGLEVGHINNISLLEDNKVMVEGVIIDKIQIPSDSILKIETNGIFGKKYFSIIPGYDDYFSKGNIVFAYTSDSYTVDYLARMLQNKLNEKN